MLLTVTAKFKIYPNAQQQQLLVQTLSAYKMGLNAVSDIVFRTRQLVQPKLHELTYNMLRSQYGLRSQMAQSVMKSVIAKYRTHQTNGHEWNKCEFKKPDCDLVWNRDYSLIRGIFSVNTLNGRIRVSFEDRSIEQYLDGSWEFGTAKLIHKYGKFFLHIPMSKKVERPEISEIKNVVGVDLGINFLATTFDSKNKARFYSGKQVKQKRARFVSIRKELQIKQTPSARRRLKAIGSRESRWMTDVNHQLSKALIEQAGPNSLIALEDLTGVRSASEKVRVKNRYLNVSWAFFQLRRLIEYKAVKNHSLTVAFTPKHTSQKCPKCGHTHKLNRNKNKRIFMCRNCGYQSNDDRVAAMNLHAKGIEYIHAELIKQAT